MVSAVVLWAVTAGAHEGAEPLGRTIAVRVAAPTAGLEEGEVICFTVTPTLQTPDIAFDEGDHGASCTSDELETRACLHLAPGATWPDRFPDLVCRGEGHELRATWVPGYDPHDDLSDGVRLVRLLAPEALEITHSARFAAPGWPDATGILRGGSCTVADEVLTVTFHQPVEALRQTCTIEVEHDDGTVEARTIPIRLVNRLRR